MPSCERTIPSIVRTMSSRKASSRESEAWMVHLVQNSWREAVASVLRVSSVLLDRSSPVDDELALAVGIDRAGWESATPPLAGTRGRARRQLHTRAVARNEAAFFLVGRFFTK